MGIFKMSKNNDTEYYGGYITKIRHYDDWDEWIVETCTRMVYVGEDEDGNSIYEEEEYDCSHREYHAERWVYETNLSNYEHFLTRQQFEEVLKRFKYPKFVFVDMHRHYYTKDGDAQDYFWPKTKETIRTITEEHSYKNKVKNSKSIFNFENITKKEAKELKLYDYPNINDMDQNPILSNGFNVTQKEVEAIKYLNGYYGRQKQFRMFVLLFPSNVGIERAFKQQSYWQGGNKNELVVCFGIKSDRTVDWCYAFSWEDQPKLEVETMSMYRNGEKLDIAEYGDWVINNLSKWKRKEFKDFEYIKTQISKTQYIILTVIIMLLDIILGYCLATNDYMNELFKNKKNQLWKRKKY